MQKNPQFSANMFTFTKEIITENFVFIEVRKYSSEKFRIWNSYKVKRVYRLTGIFWSIISAKMN